ncbi:hypothetical protein JOF53_004322 [Crossiella equi]|uniref:Uncharacterized protein n=1 Tax=Crossiella equi TaxID=130796 RepID=A0ABS5AIB6_9PSEU|nr:hypothetical protein [Crossiella equi]MBP2475450.1 hypothetical protein [Crossiella equi]
MATFVLVQTEESPAHWPELVADLTDRGDTCLLADLTTAPADQHADRVAWAATRSRTSPYLVVHGEHGPLLDEVLRRFHFAAVVYLGEEPVEEAVRLLGRAVRMQKAGHP